MTRTLVVSLMFAAALAANASVRPRTFRMQGDPAVGPTPASNVITDILVDGSTVWLGSGKGLSVSSDGGRSWTNYYKTDAFGTEDVSAIAIQQVPAGKLLVVATAHSEDVQGDLQGGTVPVGTGLRIRYLSGSDTAWRTVSQPLDDATLGKTITYGKFTYNALPVTVPQQNICYDVSITPGGTIYIASFAGGLRRSTDLGATWERVFLPGDGTLDITPTSQTAYDIELNPLKNLNHRVFSVLCASDSLIFCGTARGVNRSTDGGRSWHRYSHAENKGLSGNFIVALARQVYGSTSVLWAASIDADKTADPTEQRAVSISTDDGATWRTVDVFRDIFTHNFGFLGGIAYAATDTGMFRSDDAGLTWTVRNVFRDSVRRQTVKSTNVFSVGARGLDSKVFIGTDDGLVIETETGALTKNVNVLHASKQLASETETYAYPSPFSPGQEFARIHYRVASPSADPTIRGKVTIEIFDFAMNPVRTVVRDADRDNAREYDELWDGLTDSGKRAANGVYHYSVRVDDGDRRWGKVMVLR